MLFIHLKEESKNRNKLASPGGVAAERAAAGAPLNRGASAAGQVVHHHAGIGGVDDQFQVGVGVHVGQGGGGQRTVPGDAGRARGGQVHFDQRGAVPGEDVQFAARAGALLRP